MALTEAGQGVPDSQESTAIGPLDPFLDEFRRSRYTFYRRYRTIDPVHWGAPAVPWTDGTWYVTRRDDAVRVLSDPLFTKRSASRPGNTAASSGDPVSELMSRWLFSIDPPMHDRIRRTVRDALRRRVTRSLYARIEILAANLVDELRQRESVDLIRDLALPLPVSVICTIIGLPVEDRHLLERWAVAVAPLIDAKRSPDLPATTHAAVAGFLGYLERLVEQRRKHPADDLLSELANASGEERKIATVELTANIVALFIAGHETTSNLVGTAALAFIDHPDQWQHLKRGEATAAGAVEEILRFESPVQISTRFAQSDVVLRDRRISRGQQVCVLIGAANRDPDEFVDPERFDIRRMPNRHLAFGHGSHGCIGASLGRFETRVALAELGTRVRTMETVGDGPVWKDSVTLRGLTSLPLRIT